MKNHATKRVLALLLTLAMLLPNLVGVLPVQADTITAEPNVYDIYDLTGSKTNTIKGTDETWDGQIHANVSEEHKENIVFKTKLTMGEQEVRLSVNALDGASIYDPSGYAVYINHNGGAPYIAIKRNNADLVVGSVAAVAGTWELKHFVMDCMEAMSVGRARVNKAGAVELLVTEKDRKTYVHLINLLGEHRSQTVKTFENIPAATDIQVELPLAHTPEFVRLQPENREIPYKQTLGGISIRLPSVELYTIIEIG